MYRDRSRDSHSPVDYTKTRFSQTTWFNPPSTLSFGPSLNESSYGNQAYVSTERIKDFTHGRNKKISRYRAWENPVSFCDHIKTKCFNADELITERADFENTVLISSQYDTYSSGLALASLGAGFDADHNPIGYGTWLNSQGSYASIDWVSLLDSFSEAIDSSVPQSFFLGEDAVESGIFIDAAKLILNPSHAFRKVVKLAKRYRGGGLTLGNLKRVLRGVANGHLLYQFAVKPAVHDIRATLNAHEIISKRLRFLESHRGTFVPLRVMRRFETLLDVPAEPSRHPTVVQVYSTWKSQKVTGSISAWAKVRSDLTFQPSWREYVEYFGLNKIVGTAWELIPFSFIVDWISNAQERINSMTRLRVSDPYTEVRNIVYGIKKQAMAETRVLCPLYRGTRTVISPENSQLVRRIVQTDYKRSTSLPDSLTFTDWRNIGLMKTLSLGSLIIQRSLK